MLCKRLLMRSLMLLRRANRSLQFGAVQPRVFHTHSIRSEMAAAKSLKSWRTQQDSNL